MSYAYDFNRVPGPSASEIRAADGEGALVYGTGNQQSPAYIASLESAGLHVPRIWEHNTDSILGGYAYGVAECAAFEATHPPGLVYLACDLNDGALAGRSVLPFCQGWCDTTRENAVGLYGPDDAIKEGMAAKFPKLSRWWGVVNWIRGGFPDNDPRNITFWTGLGAHLVQLIGSPIPDTDQNLILKPDWWTTGQAPTPVPLEDDDMPHIAYLKDLDGSTELMLVDGGYMNRDFGKAAPGTPLGLSKEYLDWRAGDEARASLKLLRYDLPEWSAVRDRSKV